MSPLELSRNFALMRTWRLSRERLPSLHAQMPALTDAEVDLAALRSLPITDKAIYEARAKEWLAVNRSLPDFFIRSGGTTGAPTIQWGFLPERRPAPQQPHARDGEKKILYLKAGSGRQGAVPHFPKDTGALIAPLRDAEGYRIMVELLGQRFDFDGYEPQFSRLMIPLPAAKKLAHYMLMHRIDCSDFALTEVHTFSSFVSRAWRARIEAVLQATLIDHYGFTEIQNARAHECAVCGYYHFIDGVYPEIVDADERPLAAPGAVGKLLVTRLLAENDQAMPIVRFDTGDIVEIGTPCTKAGECGFKPWGKEGHSLCIDGDDGRLYPVRYGDVQEAIDFDPLVARIDNVRHSLVTPTEGDTFPKWRLRRPPAPARRAVLEIEMVFEPLLFADTWRSFEAGLRRKLAAGNPDFARAAAMDFQLEIVGLSPGTLTDREVMKC